MDRIRGNIFFYSVCSLFLFPFSLLADLSEMTLDEKIGQLFMGPISSLRDEEHFNDWVRLLEKYHVGNAIVEKSHPIPTIQFLNRLQNRSNIPLLVSIDAEWGLGMRLADTISFPQNMTLGATENLDLIYQLGKEIGRQARLIGVHLNLAPVADVNNNPLNPVIHMRSFGEDPVQVTTFVSAYAKGLQEAGVLACAKHFPGHGDTETDSHFDLPVIHKKRERFDRVEWIPFKQLIAEGVDAVMLAHLYVPSIDPIYPTSLSASCVEILRKDLGFQGLIITDALNMRALADRYSPEEIALLARKAGCDLLLYGSHIDRNVDEILRDTIPRAFQALKNGYLRGELDLAELDRTVLRILKAKEGIGTQVGEEHLIESLHSSGALSLKKELYQEAITLIGTLDPPIFERTAYLSFGAGDILKEHFPEVAIESASSVVIAIHERGALTPEVVSIIESFGERAIVSLFTTPYVLKELKGNFPILVAYQNDPAAQEAVLNILKGKATAKGHLPIQRF